MGKSKQAAEKKSAAQAAQKAASQAAPATEGNKKEPVKVIQAGDLMEKLGQVKGNSDSLSPDGIVTALNGLKQMVHDDPNAAEYYGIGEEGVKQINMFTLQGFATVLAIECMEKKSRFAIAMLAKQPEAINAIAEYTGVSIDTKLLPAPDEEGKVEVPVEAVKITAEAAEAIKEEVQKTAGPVEVLDPTKIKDEDHLKKSLLSILVKGTEKGANLYDKVTTAISFYKSYLTTKAESDEAKQELSKKTNVMFLSEIAKLLGKCTFTIKGVGNFMFDNAARTKSPVVPFLDLRTASLNKTTGMPQIEDQMVADIVKVLIRWFADSEIATTKESIAKMEKDLEVLMQDEKKNAKGILDGKKVIENANKHIQEVEAVVTCVNMPERSTVDAFAENYTNNAAEGFKTYRMIGSKIMKSYYPNMKPSEVKMECLVHNLQQYMGVITNMFLPPLSRLTDYSEANITELEKIDAKESGAKAEEKNE